VFIELKRQDKEIYYWKNSKNLEVDFLIKEGLEIKELIQVCWNIEDEKTRKRAMDEFKIKEALVITENYDGSEEIDKKKIFFIPLWHWLIL